MPNHSLYSYRLRRDRFAAVFNAGCCSCPQLRKALLLRVAEGDYDSFLRPRNGRLERVRRGFGAVSADYADPISSCTVNHAKLIAQD
jgi:hypothetical protein